jgi:hypothetical protein
MCAAVQECASTAFTQPRPTPPLLSFQKSKLASLESKLLSGSFLDGAGGGASSNGVEDESSQEETALDPVSIGDFLLLRTTTSDAMQGWVVRTMSGLAAGKVGGGIGVPSLGNGLLDYCF